MNANCQMIDSINAITLATHDMKRAVRFYCQIGFVVRYGGEHAHFTTMHAGAARLNLIAADEQRQWSWWGRVIFYVTNVDDFYDQLVSLGHRPEHRPRDAEWGERFFHLTDPDGHELSFATPLPAEGGP